MNLKFPDKSIFQTRLNLLTELEKKLYEQQFRINVLGTSHLLLKNKFKERIFTMI